ncbi:MAG: RNA-binding protein [Methanoculleus sp. SDB]|nr:MAG: RNA-binding protein [Methanoculleus sp. SDB]
MAGLSIKKRHTIRKSDVTKLYKRLEDEIGDAASLFRSERVEMVETASAFTLYLIDRKPLLMEYGGWVFPTLRGAIDRPFSERHIEVDMGAVAFMVKGADVMRPGIVAFSDDIIAGSPVVITEERHKKPLSIGIALYDSAALRGMDRGKAVQNLHYVGDDIWSLEL